METFYYDYPNPVDNKNAGIEVRTQEEMTEDELFLLRQGGLDTYGPKVLVNPPESKAFMEAFNDIYDEAYKRYGYLYQTEDGRVVKYLSHRIVAKCDCGKTVKQ